LSSTRIDTLLLFPPISAENSQKSDTQTLKPAPTTKESQVKKIYVGNFSFSMTEQELRSMFEPYGAIESATVATDRDTGRSRGFGFVSMSNDAEAEKAMAELNGKESGGRALTVNEAKPKTERSGFGGGRGSDRGPRQRREPRW
jgi:RNA recognition motif-containing protein